MSDVKFMALSSDDLDQLDIIFKFVAVPLGTNTFELARVSGQVLVSTRNDDWDSISVRVIADDQGGVTDLPFFGVSSPGEVGSAAHKRFNHWLRALSIDPLAINGKLYGVDPSTRRLAVDKPGLAAYIRQHAGELITVEAVQNERGKAVVRKWLPQP
jgi:hypothetical protein